MKKASLAVFIIAALSGSCKKATQEHGLGAVPNDTWYLDGTMYKADSVYLAGSQQLSGLSNYPAGHFAVVFSALPATSGVYRISNSPSAGSLTASITVSTINRQYITKGYEGAVRVTVNNGKIITTVPEIWLKNAPSGNDSVRFYGAISQK